MDKDKKGEVIEINLGKSMSKVRENPWIASTFVFGLALLAVLFFGSGTDRTIVSADEASGNVFSFIQSNPDLNGQVSIISTEREGQFYKIMLNYQGQSVPIYTTLDGAFLVGNPVPLNNPVASSGNTPSAQPTQPQTGTGNQLSEDDDPVLGNENAPVTIIEYSDYQCPFCERFWSETLPQIKKKYIDTGKVKLVYRDYPLDFHPMAQPAAEAAECVHELGGNEAYFIYHDLLFENQQSLSEENLKKWAKNLGYDIGKCLDDGDFTDEVAKDFSDGGQLGTPTFFINGKKVEGAQPFSVFEQLIEAELAAA